MKSVLLAISVIFNLGLVLGQWRRDLDADVDVALSRLWDARASTQEYLDVMNDIEDLLWTKVQPGVSSIQENLPFIKITFADIENIQIQINQASSILVYQAKLQGKELVKHLRLLNQTETNLSSASYSNLPENQSDLVAQANNVNSVQETALSLSGDEVVAFNNLLNAILEGQNGTAVDEIKASMADINNELYLLGDEISLDSYQVGTTTELLYEALGTIIGQLP
ncbi:uncharacterized protein LOC132198846 isoform X2 [Neocloeon triangulifer]|uniref:uncharacterized protein LOC132198846 isoform X2 n=1 Tax=Neocloeon triangulifer TaxID=2078957 RepID=UPI00286F61A6|nr:uncharacterized protein LOC132198846 isoform X2 [Neocloeon triangulifer]